MSNIQFRMAARCEAAGRPNNEDNYQLDADLSDKEWGFTADKPIDLGKKGALLVVCDGMGGMNAGEVASDIAVSTIKECFVSDKLTTDVLASPMAYTKQAIIAADSAIKAHSKTHPETEGMGSTIVMAWMLGKKVYVGWCGDSRCYCYNSKTGLVRLSHDHSYVQELVDAGKLTEDLAFDHPHNNIITRSLGDPNGTARPDVKEFDLHDEDILLLCSDGLCGCLRDTEIEEQITAHQTSMQECRDALWAADEAAGWHDNVTIALAQIISGGLNAVGGVGVPTADITSASDQLDSMKATNKKLKIGIGLLALLLVCAVAWIAYRPIVRYWQQTHANPADSVAVVENGESIGGIGVVLEKETIGDTLTSPVSSDETTPTNTATGNNSNGKQKQPDIPEVQRVKTDTVVKQDSSAVQGDADITPSTEALEEGTEEVPDEQKSDVVTEKTLPEMRSDSTAPKQSFHRLQNVLTETQGDGISSPAK